MTPRTTCWWMLVLAAVVQIQDRAVSQSGASRTGVPGQPEATAGPREPELRAEYDNILAGLRAAARNAAEFGRLRDRAHALSQRLQDHEKPWAVELRLAFARWLRQRDLDEAFVEVKAALAIGLAAELDLQIASAYLELGHLHTTSGDSGAALAAYDASIKAFHAGNEPVGIAKAKFSRTSALSALGRIDEALTELDSTAAFFLEQGDQEGLMMVAFRRASILNAQGRYPEALAGYEGALELLRARGPDPRIAVISNNRGLVLSAMGRYEEALAAFQSAETIYTEEGNTRGVASARLNRGDALRFLGRHDEAIRELDAAIHNAEEVGDGTTKAWAMMSRGLVFAARGRFSTALAAYEQAARLFEKVGHATGLAGVEWSRGNTLAEIGRREDALQAYDRALAAHRDVGNLAGVAQVLMNRGLVLAGLSREEQALLAYAEAEPLLAQAGDAPGLADLILNRSLALSYLGRFEEALANLDIAADRFRALQNDNGAIWIARARGDIYRTRKDYARAISEYATSLRGFQEMGDQVNVAALQQAIASTHRTTGNHAGAVAGYLESAEQFTRMIRSESSRLGPGSSESLRDRFAQVVPALLASRQALPAAQRPDLAACHHVLETFHGIGLAELTAEQGRFPAQQRSAELSARLTAAREALERALARRDGIDLSSGPPDRRLAARAEHAKASQDVRSRQQQLEEVVERERLEHRIQWDLVHPRPSTLEQIRAALAEQSLLVQFALGEEGAFAFVISQQSCELVELGAVSEIEIPARRLAEVLRRAQTPTAAELRQLGKRVLDPVLGLAIAQGKTTLLFAPHGALCEIPFELLLTAETSATTTADSWPYLIKDHEVGYVHSGTVLCAMQAERRSRQPTRGLDFVGIGHPVDALRSNEAPLESAPGTSEDATRGQRAPLPETAQEVLQIARLFATDAEERARLEAASRLFREHPSSREITRIEGVRHLVLLRDEAQERILKSDARIRSAAVVHIACHGEVDIITPSLSRLVLSKDAGTPTASSDDGFLYLGELLDLNLCCDLLVLSSCDSTRGRISRVDGKMGLARAAMAGGAGAILATEWEIGDQSAREMMVRFYESLLSDASRATPIVALANAKRAAIRRGLPIHAWSAYVLWTAGPTPR